MSDKNDAALEGRLSAEANDDRPKIELRRFRVNLATALSLFFFFTFFCNTRCTFNASSRCFAGSASAVWAFISNRFNELVGARCCMSRRVSCSSVDEPVLPTGLVPPGPPLPVLLKD